MGDVDIARPTCILKTESNGIHADQAICMGLLDPITGKLRSYGGPGEPSVAAGVDAALAADIVTHSSYHVRLLERLYGVRFDPAHVFDTLHAAEILCGKQPGGDGLSAWARRLGMQRVEFRGAPEWCQEAADHCAHDCGIIDRLYGHLLNLVAEQDAAA